MPNLFFISSPSATPTALATRDRLALGRTEVMFFGGCVWSVAFNPDGKTLASAGQDGSIKIWRVSSQ